MTSEDTEIAYGGGGNLTQQFGAFNLHIENNIALSLALRSAPIEKKITDILRSINSHPHITDGYYNLMIEIIRACKCKSYKNTRFTSRFERTVIIDTHQGNKND
jgi:hypothetical protein